jgi:hypothetical protein
LGNIDPGSPSSGPGSSPHDTDEEWFEALTDTLSVPVIIHSVSLKLMLCQLLLQVNISFHRVSMSTLIPLFLLFFLPCQTLPGAVFSKKALCKKLALPSPHCQLEPRALRTGISLKAQGLLRDLKELLCSFPWVQVTEEKQEANTFRQSTAVYQVDNTEGHLSYLFYLFKISITCWAVPLFCN